MHTVILRVRVLRTLVEKSVGLIGAKRISPIFFTSRSGIHTFGMHSPIDVLILNDDNHVVITHHMKPHRLFFWNPRYSRVVELPAGSVIQKKITIGTKIVLGPLDISYFKSTKEKEGSKHVRTGY